MAAWSMSAPAPAAAAAAEMKKGACRNTEWGQSCIQRRSQHFWCRTWKELKCCNGSNVSHVCVCVHLGAHKRHQRARWSKCGCRSAAHQFLFQRRAANDTRQNNNCNAQIQIQFFKQHVHCDVMIKDVCAPVKVSAHDVQVQRHQGWYAVKPSLKSGNRGLQALAQVLDEREGNAAHV